MSSSITPTASLQPSSSSVGAVGVNAGGPPASPLSRHRITVRAKQPPPPTNCAADSGLPPLVSPPSQAVTDGGLPTPLGWVPDLDGLLTAASFPHLRQLLSGRATSGWDTAPKDLTHLMEEYRAVHAEVLAGARPLRVFLLHCTGGGPRVGDCGGLGDRVKSLRMFFYLCLLSGRALVLADDWDGVKSSTVFSPLALPDL
jgi:hypothetical protein